MEGDGEGSRTAEQTVRGVTAMGDLLLGTGAGGLWQAWGAGVDSPSRNRTANHLYADSPTYSTPRMMSPSPFETRRSTFYSIVQCDLSTIMAPRLPPGRRFDAERDEVLKQPLPDGSWGLRDITTGVVTPFQRERLPLTLANIDLIATELEMTTGSWAVFRPRKTVDEVWSRIAEATQSGRLGFCATVVTREGTNAMIEYFGRSYRNHIIEACTGNYLDHGDVQRVRVQLRALGVTERLYYRPGIYDTLALYDAQTHISPWRYHDD